MSGISDDHDAGAVWAYTKESGGWTELGKKLTGCVSSHPPGLFGFSVAVSGDGRTALVGCAGFDHEVGAAAVFVRAGGEWRQSGPLLRPVGAVGHAHFGFRVALSFNGQVAAIAGPVDSAPKADQTLVGSDGRGAVWVYARRGSSWHLDGQKITGSGESAIGDFGDALGLSADGKTLLVAASNTNDGRGAVWFFVDNPTGWQAVGGKHPGPAAHSEFGFAVALADNGRVALVGAPGADGFQGTVTTFQKTQDDWRQLGEPLKQQAQPWQPEFGTNLVLTGTTGTHAVIAALERGHIQGVLSIYDHTGIGWKLDRTVASPTPGLAFGYSIAVSRTGMIGIVGAPSSNKHRSVAGAAWIFPYL